jgi:hypothetical protein
MKHLGSTPPFRGPDGTIFAGSIAEVAYVNLGGVDQWVMIRGENLANAAGRRQRRIGDRPIQGIRHPLAGPTHFIQPNTRSISSG